MKNIRNYILLGILIISFNFCEKDKNVITGQLIVKESGEPLVGFYMLFDVSNGDFFFGSTDKAKYDAISDNNGYFSFEVDKDDIDEYFYINDFSSGNHCWRNLDTNDIQNMYIISPREDRFIKRNEKTKLLYSPSGIIDFYVTEEEFNRLGVDTVLVSSNYDTDTLIGTGTNKVLYVEPSQYHDFKFEAIKNGIVILTKTKKIYVSNYCPDGTIPYPVEFE